MRESEKVEIIEQFLMPSLVPELSYALRLKSIANVRNTGLVRVCRRNGGSDTLILDNAATAPTLEVELDKTQLADEFWLEFERGGIVEIEFAVIEGVDDLCSDTVRATGIAVDPNPGGIVFVNPSGTSGSPFNDFSAACATTLTAGLAAAQEGDNVVVAGETYFEHNLQVNSGILIAGLGAKFSTDLDAHPTGFDFSDVPVVDGNDSGWLFASSETESVGIAGLALRRGKSVISSGGALKLSHAYNAHVDYVILAGNQASTFGGAVCLDEATNTFFSGCVVSNNIVDFEDMGDVVYDRGMGGGIAALESTLTVTNCLFKGNVAQVSHNGDRPTEKSAGGGGDIYLRSGGLTVCSTRFENSRAGFPQPKGVLDEPDEYLTGDGGAILIHGLRSNTTLTVSDCEFNETQAYGNGGGISLSRDSSPDGRRYFVGALGGWQWPPVVSAPEALGGGCIGVISNVVFIECQGGWQGGAISANGRGMSLQILSSTFEACKGGMTHKVDGKGGAIAVCGGVQSDSEPENDVMLTGKCVINACQASGNGGGVYVTIRGSVSISDTSITACSALDEATALPSHDFRRSEGMGGGAHVSAGGRLSLGSASGGSVKLYANTAMVSGGGVSVKSATVWVLGAVSLSGNKASGNAVDGYGNGGGVYVTTSYHDDNPVEFNWDWPPVYPGAGWGAASLYNEDGNLLSYVSSFSVNNNEANRWGGGVYAGISPPWYGSIPPSNMCAAVIMVQNGSISGNTAGTRANTSTCFPAQIAIERIGDDGASANFDGAAISGHPTNDIGIYVWNSISPTASATTFSSLGISYLEEP